MFDPVNYDDVVIVPLPFIRNMLDLRRSPQHCCTQKSSGRRRRIYGSARMTMRSVRRLRPVQKDNFALNKMSFLDDALSELFNVIGLAGWVIGGFFHSEWGFWSG
jgi:putative ABC transport system permease protein